MCGKEPLGKPAPNSPPTDPIWRLQHSIEILNTVWSENMLALYTNTLMQYTYMLTNARQCAMANNSHFLLFSRSLPKHGFSPESYQSYTRVPLEPNSSEFQKVERLFRESMKEDKVIVSVERVENPFMWETFCR